MKQGQNVEKELGAQLRKKRIRLGLSQEGLAFESDLSQTSISRVERGGRSSQLVYKTVADTLDRLEVSQKR